MKTENKTPQELYEYWEPRSLAGQVEFIKLLTDDQICALADIAITKVKQTYEPKFQRSLTEFHNTKEARTWFKKWKHIYDTELEKEYNLTVKMRQPHKYLPKIEYYYGRLLDGLLMEEYKPKKPEEPDIDFMDDFDDFDNGIDDFLGSPRRTEILDDLY